MALLLAAACTATDPAGGPAPGVSCATGTLDLQGSSAQANAMEVWTRRYQEACRGATINYEPSGSGAGITSFIAGVSNFAGTDSPLTPPERREAETRCADGRLLSLPMIVGPVAVAYHLSGVPTLRLSPATVARIFANAVQRWDDPAIRADNPGVALPARRIRSVHRSDSSGTTEAFTGFLDAVAPQAWPHGAGRRWTAPGGAAESGSASLLREIRTHEGAIGYVESSLARGKGLRVAAVGNRSGHFVAPSAQAAAKTVGGPEADFRLPIDPATPLPDAYPIVLVTYEVVCERGLAADDVQLARSFLSYTASDAGQRAAIDLGYAPLPEPPLEAVRAAIGRIS